MVPREDDRGRRRRVERWDTLKVLHKGLEVTSDADISFVVEIKQPIFEGGGRGFPKMNATLKRGDRFLRLSCFDGDIAEIRALVNLLKEVEKEIDGFNEHYEDYMDDYRAQQDNRGNEMKREKRRYDGVGEGLSRYSGERRTERRNRRDRGERRP